MMSKEIYKELLEVMKKRGGRWSGMDIPEFYEMVEEMFTPEEAGLVHMSLNTSEDIEFLCNCDRWNCVE